MILGKIREIRNQSPRFFLKNTNFGNPCLGPLTLNIRHCVQPCFNLGQILNQAKVAGPQKACHAESRCNFLIFVSKFKCSVKKKVGPRLYPWLFIKTRKFRGTLQSLSRHTVWETLGLVDQKVYSQFKFVRFQKLNRARITKEKGLENESQKSRLTPQLKQQ